MSREGILEGADVFCLHFVGVYGHGNFKRKSLAVEQQLKCLPFVLPEGLSRQDAFKVISFIMENEENKIGLPKNGLASVRYADMMLNSFGFKHILDEEVESVHLYIVGGEKQTVMGIREVKNTKNAMFNWFTPNVKKEEVEEIYAKCNLKLPKFESEKDREI